VNMAPPTSDLVQGEEAEKLGGAGRDRTAE
jgi:hypothetical protein